MPLIKYYKLTTCYDGKIQFSWPKEEKEGGQKRRYYPDEYRIADILLQYAHKKREVDHWGRKLEIVIEPADTRKHSDEAKGADKGYKNTAAINDEILRQIERAEKQGDDEQSTLILAPFLYGYHHPGIAINVTNKHADVTIKHAIYIDPKGQTPAERGYPEAEALLKQLTDKGFTVETVKAAQQGKDDGTSCGPILTASMIKLMEEFLEKGTISAEGFQARPHLATDRLFQIYVNNRAWTVNKLLTSARWSDKQLLADEIMLADPTLWQDFFAEQLAKDIDRAGESSLVNAIKIQQAFIAALKPGWERDELSKNKVQFICEFQSRAIELIFLKKWAKEGRGLIQAFILNFNLGDLSGLPKPKDLLAERFRSKTHKVLGIHVSAFDDVEEEAKSEDEAEAAFDDDEEAAKSDDAAEVVLDDAEGKEPGGAEEKEPGVAEKTPADQRSSAPAASPPLSPLGLPSSGFYPQPPLRRQADTLPDARLEVSQVAARSQASQSPQANGWLTKFNNFTRKHNYIWGAFKWLAIGAVGAAILYFSGGLAALPFLAKLGAAAIPVVTPVLAVAKGALWKWAIKPLLRSRFGWFRSPSPEQPHSDAQQSPRSLTHARVQRSLRREPAVHSDEAKSAAVSDADVEASWYAPGEIEKLMYAPYAEAKKTSKALRALLIQGDKESTNHTFPKQLERLRWLRGQVKAPFAIFITMPDAKSVAGHFVMGLVIKGRLLMINPWINPKDENTLPKLPKYVGTARAKNEEIILSNTSLQKDGKSCGPICVELLRHLSTLSEQELTTLLDSAEKTQQMDPEMGAYQIIDLASRSGLLPPSLQNLLKASPGEEYARQAQAIADCHQAILAQYEQPLANEGSTLYDERAAMYHLQFEDDPIRTLPQNEAFKRLRARFAPPGPSHGPDSPRHFSTATATVRTGHPVIGTATSGEPPAQAQDPRFSPSPH